MTKNASWLQGTIYAVKIAPLTSIRNERTIKTFSDCSPKTQQRRSKDLLLKINENQLILF